MNLTPEVVEDGERAIEYADEYFSGEGRFMETLTWEDGDYRITVRHRETSPKGVIEERIMLEGRRGTVVYAKAVEIYGYADETVIEETVIEE